MKRKQDATDIFSLDVVSADLLAEQESKQDDDFDFGVLFNEDDTFSIFFSDLTPEAQKSYLEFIGAKSEEGENFELSPLAVIGRPEDEIE